MEPSVHQNIDPSSSDEARSLVSLLPEMEPTSDQLVLMYEDSDNSKDTVVQEEYTDVLDVS